MSGNAPVLLAVLIIAYLLLRFRRQVLALIVAVAVVCLAIGVHDMVSRLNR